MILYVAVLEYLLNT